MSSPTGPPPGREIKGGGGSVVAVAGPAGAGENWGDCEFAWDIASGGSFSTGGIGDGAAGAVSGARPAAICAWRSSSSMSSGRAGVSPAIGFLSLGRFRALPRSASPCKQRRLLLDEREVAEQHRPQDRLA